MSKGAIHVGTGGWNYPPWRGVFYPPGLPQKRELEFLSRALNSVEINGTFYSAFKPENFARWRDETPDGFVFSLKGSRYCTNRKELGDAGEAIERFVGQGIVELRDKLGPINWQFAATKKFDAQDFEAFLKLLPAKAGRLPLRHALEPRNASFQCEEFYDLARRYGCAIVFADSAEYPRIDQPIADFTYARLMRNEEQVATGYSEAALGDWAQRAATWTSRGDVFIYFIAGAKLRAPAAAQSLLSRL
ncbi:MAG: DUF72 domain-containing protein [Alphaproteobacteria bacterium]|nr:DUF72 domain-containing protein [Alphaproteobacteria bacterium]